MRLLSSLKWIRQKYVLSVKNVRRIIIVSKTAKDTLIKSTKARKDGREEEILIPARLTCAGTNTQNHS